MRPLLVQIRCPTLVIQGSEDEQAAPSQAQDIAAAIPDAELWLVPGADHMLQRNSAKALNHKLLEFIIRTTDGR
jgi:pimeloyl-ACP methyl ester carboxylesterase